MVAGCSTFQTVSYLQVPFLSVQAGLPGPGTHISLVPFLSLELCNTFQTVSVLAPFLSVSIPSLTLQLGVLTVSYHLKYQTVSSLPLSETYSSLQREPLKAAPLLYVLTTIRGYCQ